MSYIEMSDFEINCAVAGVLGREFFSNEKPDDSGRRRKSYEIDGRHRDICESGWTSEVFDPCNSWADAGPIIEKQRITIAYDGEEKSAHPCAWVNVSSIDNLHAIKYQHPEKTLRASMIIFLMMQEKPDAA